MTLIIAQHTISRILEQYGLEGATVMAASSGYRNAAYPINLPDGTRTNLILYKSEPGILTRITAANHVSNCLADRGLPTRRTLDRIIKIQGHTRAGEPRTKYACLYNYLPGNTIPWEAYTKDHIKLLGLAMSRMHSELATTATPVSIQAQPFRTSNHHIGERTPSVIAENQQTLERLQRYFAQAGVTSALTTKLHLQLNPRALTSAQATLSLASKLPDHQPLHLDFVRGNILFGPAADHPETRLTLNDLAITGIIDFEKTAVGPRIFDLARTLAFLLVDCKTKTPAQVFKYFLHSGYNKRGSTSFKPPIVVHRGRRVDLLQALINFYLLHDFYKFLRHNPYESLPENEHFVRTVALLQQRGYL
jgi:Ser/Thr protein kinase RdoA (MazF antagonist)